MIQWKVGDYFTTKLCGLKVYGRIINIDNIPPNIWGRISTNRSKIKNVHFEGDEQWFYESNIEKCSLLPECFKKVEG